MTAFQGHTPGSFGTLEAWLAHCESLHPLGVHGIDLGLARVQTVVKRLQLHFACPVIMVAGTNGKGSTCAMLESIYGQAGFHTGVYSSPHLWRFEERCRLRGESVAAQTLLPHFAAVEAARGNIQLTYFEFTTLAILRCLAQAELDVVILEVGLGGRLDAVNSIDADCAIITHIDIDHAALLGETRDAIAREKAGIMRPGRPVIISDPVPPASLHQQAQEVAALLWQLGRDFHYSGDAQQWNWRISKPEQTRSLGGLAYPALRGANQLCNASAAIMATYLLRDRLPVPTQALRNGLALVQLPGRFQVMPGQPVLVFDVAHNPHASATLAHNLDAMGHYPRTLAVFGAMRDKDIKSILQQMEPIIDVWHFCDLPSPRAATAQELYALWSPLPRSHPCQAHTHSDPASALQAARTHATEADRIVVFGSFYTVGGAHPAPNSAAQ